MAFFGLDFSFPQLGQVPVKHVIIGLHSSQLRHKLQLAHSVTTKGLIGKNRFVLRKFVLTVGFEYYSSAIPRVASKFPDFSYFFLDHYST